MQLLDICEGAGIKCPEHLATLEIEGITSRSHEIKENYVFVCLKGTKNDGHGFIEDALSRGACAVIVENKKYLCENSILVDNTRIALSKMLNVFYGEPTKKLRFIAVTGTNGKTSVSVMIKNIFETLHIPCELIGTLNCSSFSKKTKLSQANFTTPDPEELYKMLHRMSDGGVELVIMEASSHALKLHKLDPIFFDVAIFTNLTEDHLDFHCDMEDYFKSKLRLFDQCGLGIINIDDEYGKRILKHAKCKIKTCSMSQDADYIASEVENLFENGSKFKILYENDELALKCNIPGRFSILNAMQSCACAIEFGIDNNIIKRSFEALKNVKGRLEKTELFKDRGFAVYMDYAHTPDALLKLLETAHLFKTEGQRVVLLFGCGGDREKQKRKIMGGIAVSKADFVIITSDNPRSEEPLKIIDDILSGVGENKNFTVIPDRRRAIEYAIATARKGDIILLAGKGHENYEISSNGVQPFDEREILKDIEKQGGMKYED